MTRAARLLTLLQDLRRRRLPVSAAVLAQELGISIRTLYRDIATLQAQGAPIVGEPGVGYVLRPGYLLPPLMWTAAELEALMLGMRWVHKAGDPGLRRAAADAAAKIEAVLPTKLRTTLDHTTLLVGPRIAEDCESVDLDVLRTALREERKLRLDYTNHVGIRGERTVWPVALGYFDTTRILVAWCEARAAFRHFRTDRMHALTLLPDPMPRSGPDLLQAWRDAGLDRAVDPAADPLPPT